MKSKSFIKYGLSITFFIILLPALFVFIVDPIQLYHEQITLKKVKYFKEQRYQNIGLVNKFLKRSNKNYNTLIVGTSMSENSLSSKYENILNNDDKVLKLAMRGGRPSEQLRVLEKALKTGKIKRVIWDIHWYYLLKNISQKDKNHDFPDKLYSNSIFKQGFYYLFNKDYIEHSLFIFTGKGNGSKWTGNLDKLNYTYSYWIKNNAFKKFTNKKNIYKLNKNIKAKKREIPTYKDLEKQLNTTSYDSVDNYVVPILKQYKEIQFNIFFPPYSTYFYKTTKYDNALRYIYARKYLVDKTIHFSNVKIFGFDNNYAIVNNLNNYKDYGHYRTYINDFIMKSTTEDKNILDTNNIGSYIQNMISNINQYDEIVLENVFETK